MSPYLPLDMVTGRKINKICHHFFSFIEIKNETLSN